MVQTLKKCGIGLCVSLIAAIYTLSLVRFEPWYASFAAISWRGYLIQTVLMLAAGWLLVFLNHRISNREYGIPFVLACIGALISASGAYALCTHSPVEIARQMLISVWPLILLVWARFWKGKYTLRCPAAPYYAGIGVMCWGILDVLSPTPWLRWDLPVLAYMILTAFWVWRSYFISTRHLFERYGERLFSRRGRLILRLQSWIPLAAAILLILFFHDRAQQILLSLLPSPAQHSGRNSQVNWLIHRLSFMAEGWQGSFSVVDAALIRDLPMSAPLVWISLRLTPAAAAGLVCAQFGILYLLYRLKRNTGWRPLSLSCVLVECLTVQTVLGLLVELMLNTSSPLGMPLLRSPGSALLLPLCAAADPCHDELLEQLGNQLRQRLQTQLEARGLLPSRTELPEDWQLYCPPWDGEMTLKSAGWATDMVRYDSASYSAIQLQWISQETEEDGSTRRIRQPHEQTTCYADFPIQAAGKTYHSLDQLTCGNKGHCRLYRDIHNRLVFQMVKPFPCFDEFDAMCETRMYRWFFLREGDKLTRIHTSDDSSEIYVTEDVERLECSVWEHMLQWGYFTNHLT